MVYLRSVIIVLFLFMAQLTFATRVRVMRDSMLNKRGLATRTEKYDGRELKTNAARMAAGMPPLPPRSLYPGSRVQGRAPKMSGH